MGYDNRTSWVAVIVVLLQLMIAYGLQSLSLSLKPLPFWMGTIFLAYFLGSILSHWSSMVIHEASHNLAAKKPWQNITVAIFSGIPLLIPAAMSFRRYHLAHHARLGELPGDTDLPLKLELKYFNTPVRRLAWLFLYFPVYTVRSFSFMQRLNALELLNIGVNLIAWLLLYPLLGTVGVTYLLLSLLFGHSLHPVAAHFIHEHYVIRPGQETYSYYGPLNWVSFNVGYHVEHHDISNVPGWKLPQLRSIAFDFYKDWEGHRSWTWVLWHFVFAKEMGLHRRIVRSPFKKQELALR